MENALLVSINHWNQLNDLQLTFLFDSWYYTYNYNVQNIICVLLSFLWFIFSNITLFSIHEFWWLIAKNRHLFTDFFLIQKQSYHFTEIKIHLFRFSRGVYTSLFMKHKRMLFLCVWIESQISYLLLLSVPKNMDELKNKVQDIPQKLAQSVGEVTEKCSLQ